MPTIIALQSQLGTAVTTEYQLLTEQGELLVDSLLREEGRVNLKRLGVLSALAVHAAPPGYLEEDHERRQASLITGYARTRREEDAGLSLGVLIRVDRDEALAPITRVLWRLGIAGGVAILPMLGLLLWATHRLRSAWSHEQARYRELVQSLDAIVWEGDAADLRVTFASPQVERVLGYRPEQWVKNEVTWNDLIHPDDLDWVLRQCAAETAAGRGHTLEYRMRTADGQVIWIKDIMTVITEPGRPVKLCGVLVDITEQKRAEETLQELWQAIEASPSLVMITDAEARIEYVNPKVAQVTGYAVEELIGRDATTLGAQSPEQQAQMWNTLRAGQEWRGEFPNRKKSGERYWEAASISCVGGPDGRVSHYVKVAEDITLHKQMAAEGRRLERLATLGQLLGGIAHELKNPLFIITGRLQLLEDKLARRDYGATGTDLQKMEAAVRRMTWIAERFLSLARPTPPHQQWCLVTAILREVMEFLANELMMNQIRTERQGPDRLPPIRSDPQQLHEVFLNLILNAMQAMVSAHGRGTLTVGTKLVTATEHAAEPPPPSPLPRREGEGWGGGAWIEVRIQDDGPGIAPEHHAKLFEPFFSTKPPGQGTGLGLWTVRSILTALKGRVTFETEPGRGTTFIVRLPVPETGEPPSAT